jgi:hypothetical protein
MIAEGTKVESCMSVERVVPETVTIFLSPEMREQLAFLVSRRTAPFDAVARELLAEELEAQVGLMRGPFLRKYMYR